MSDNCVQHLQLRRDAWEGRRLTRLTRGLNCFLEGRTDFATAQQRDQELTSRRARKRALFKQNHLAFRNERNGLRDRTERIVDAVTDTAKGHSHRQQTSQDSGTTTISPSLTKRKSSSQSLASSGTSAYQTSEGDTSESNAMIEEMNETRRESGEDTTSEKGMFARAANLLSQSLHLDDSGGVMFVRTVGGLLSGSSNVESLPPTPGEVRRSAYQTASRKSEEVPINLAETPQSPNEDAGNQIEDQVRTDTTFDLEKNEFSSQKRPVELLGLNCTTILQKSELAQDGILPLLAESSLQELQRVHPMGKLWNFDQVGSLASDSDNGQSDATLPRQSNHSRKKLLEGKMLQNHFPGARQLIFAPLWDSSAGRWYGGAFVWSTDETFVFTPATDLSYVVTFAKAVMAELSRVQTVAADRQKRSVSVVWFLERSPLTEVLLAISSDL